jgi:hypothetical protein
MSEGHRQHMEATRIAWAVGAFGENYSLSPGAVQNGTIRWFCGPNAPRKARRDRRAAAAARPQRTLTRAESEAVRQGRLPETFLGVNRRLLELAEARRPSPASEQLDLLGGES